MIDSQDNYQLELFREAKGGMPRMPRGSRFFNFLRRNEKKILIAIGVAASCIIAFSWGVKRGRGVSSLKNEPRFDLAVNPVRDTTPQITEEKTTVVVIKPAQEKAIAPRRQSPVTPVQSGGANKEKAQIDAQEYTIQLASYKAKEIADTQADRLKKKGLASFVLKKGNYIILCVGRFSGKEEAKNQLSKLKRDYKDCYLRRL